ncbi:MAG: type II toxin-antitoxin system RelE/ParE family toxin [Gammaproteobacteria bacterium]|nr:type II toxin-antitoxin system RelE/ParE family toxin [Gammaproteobacteria bacterium]
MKAPFFLPPAEEEMFAAAQYYESRAPGLGVDFLAEIKWAIEAMALHPNLGTVIRGQIRRCLVRRFPYGVLYRIEAEGIIVVAVMHLHRRPGYWRNRL